MHTYVSADCYDTALCDVAYVGTDKQAAITALEYDSEVLQHVAKFGKSLCIGKLLVYVRGSLTEEYNVFVCIGFNGAVQYYTHIVK